MKKTNKSLTACIFVLMLFVSISGSPVLADNWEKVDDSSWCREHSSFFNNSACEVRELTVNETWEKIRVDANPNGGIKVEGWDRDSIRIRARVQANAGSARDAEEILSEIDIETGGNEIHAEGPKYFGSKKSWFVSYSLIVPLKSNLKLSALNGGISVDNVSGDIRAKTVNGGITLEKVSGDVVVDTTNGGITAELNDDKWQGRRFEARTTNGGIKVEVPEDYSADLKASTVNGGIHVDFPIKVQGCIKKNVETTLGDGGAPLVLRTVNGGISIEKK